MLPPRGCLSCDHSCVTTLSCVIILTRVASQVYKRLEEVVGRCAYMEWKHFDAGVIKVCWCQSQAAELDTLGCSHVLLAAGYTARGALLHWDIRAGCSGSSYLPTHSV